MALPGLAWDDLLSLAIAIFALVPFTIALLAYRRTSTTRVLLFACAFGAIFVKGIFVTIETMFFDGNPTLEAIELICDASTLLFFFAGMLKG